MRGDKPSKTSLKDTGDLSAGSESIAAPKPHRKAFYRLGPNKLPDQEQERLKSVAKAKKDRALQRMKPEVYLLACQKFIDKAAGGQTSTNYHKERNQYECFAGIFAGLSIQDRGQNLTDLRPPSLADPTYAINPGSASSVSSSGASGSSGQ